MLRRPIFVLPLMLVLPLAAQMHHVDKPQRVTRAIGVYEWTGNLAKPDAARLIPVSIFTSGQLRDAGVFLAQPIPLALDTGNVYVLQKSGDPIGTVDLDYARNVVDRRSTADDNPIGAWYGYGRFHPPAAAPVVALHPSSHLPVIASTADDDSQPHFVNRTPGEAGNPSAPASPSASSTSSNPSTSKPPADPDRPILHRAPNSSSTGATADNAPISPGTSSIPDDDPDRPTLGRRGNENDKQNDKHKHHKSSRDSGAVIPLSTSLNDDPDRPMLRPGKTVSEQAAPALTGLPANMHQAIAVSDAANRPTHVFSRDWDSPSERAETLAALEKLAQPLTQQYMTANRLQAAPPSTGPTLITTSHKSSKLSKSSRTRHSAHRSKKSALPPPLAFLTFHDEQLTGFTLSYGGLPTFVYTASVPTTTAGQSVHITLIVQRLPTGNLQTSLSSITDDVHLNRTPWMRLIDAVDADASHRASLLFELRERSSRQFALYSLAYARARQTFVTGILE